MLTAFERLIKDFPKSASVLDVGYGGLDGENTTNYLRAHFNQIWGLSKDATQILRYRELIGAQDPVVLGLYPNTVMDRTFDLVVLDTSIDGNLDFWSYDGLNVATRFVRKGGYLITYILMTDDYGDENTKARLKKHRAMWWKKGVEGRLIHPFTAIEILQEERRPEILWILMRYE